MRRNTAAIQALADTEDVTLSRPTVETGLAVLDAGGDFAEGLIAYEGTWLAERLVSFDKKAVPVLARQGFGTRLLT